MAGGGGPPGAPAARGRHGPRRRPLALVAMRRHLASVSPAVRAGQPSAAGCTHTLRPVAVCLEVGLLLREVPVNGVYPPRPPRNGATRFRAALPAAGDSAEVPP